MLLPTNASYMALCTLYGTKHFNAPYMTLCDTLLRLIVKNMAANLPTNA
jgi:hypothetical protein